MKLKLLTIILFCFSVVQARSATLSVDELPEIPEPNFTAPAPDTQDTAQLPIEESNETFETVTTVLNPLLPWIKKAHNKAKATQTDKDQLAAALRELARNPESCGLLFASHQK